MKISQDKKKRKRERGILEKEIFRLMESSMKVAFKVAMDDIFKDWNNKG